MTRTSKRSESAFTLYLYSPFATIKGLAVAPDYASATKPTVLREDSRLRCTNTLGSSIADRLDSGVILWNEQQAYR